MFFLIKLLKPFILPPTLFAIGLIVSIFLIHRKKYRVAKILLIIIFVMYYLFSIQFTADLLAYSLERQYQAAAEINQEEAQAIVILAGGVDKPSGGYPAELGGVSWRRLWRGVEVYRQLAGKTPILYSGASGDPFDPYAGEALLAKQYAVSMGIPEEHFWTETESRTTAESGKAINRFLEQRFPDIKTHKIILITSGIHMPRSVAVIKRQGIKVIPVPADLQNSKGIFSLNPLDLLPSAGSFGSSVASIHEWVGMVGYWVFGYASI